MYNYVGMYINIVVDIYIFIVYDKVYGEVMYM